MSVPLAVALCAGLVTPAAWGAAKYYSTTAGALNWADSGGSSLWGTVTGGPYTSAWAASDTAIFEGTGGAVTVTGPVTAGTSTSISFTSDGYTLSAGSAQTITFGGNISVASTKSATIGDNVTVTKANTSILLGGGTLNVTGAGAVVQSTGGSSTISVSGGTKVVVGTGGTLLCPTSIVIGSDTAANNALEVNGGVVNITSTGTSSLVLANGASGSATITLNNGSILNSALSGGLRFGPSGANSASSSFNLDGGTLTVAKVSEGNAGHSSTFNFNGGTLKVLSGSASLAAFMAVDTANVRTNGAIIDPNGQAVTIGQALLHFDPTTDGGLTVNDSAVTKGSLTLTSSGHTYNGPTTITAGTLKLSGAAALPSSPSISIANGATFDVSAQTTPTLAANQNLLGSGSVNGSLTTVATTKIYPGTDGTAGTLTFKNNLTLHASTQVQLDLSSTSGGSNDKIVLDGTGAVLSPNGAQITIKSAGTLDTSASDYVLIDLTGSGASFSGSFSGTLAWAGTTPANFADYSIVTTSTQVKLHYAGTTTSPAGVGLASPATVTHGLTPLLTVTVTPGTGPVSTGIAVTANLSSIGGAASQTFYDNGSNGDVTAGDNVFSYAYTIPVGTSLGAKSLSASITDAQSRSASASIDLSVVVASITWGATPAGVDWGTPGNWANGFSPAAGDFVYFDTSTQLSPNLETAYSVDSVTFNSGAGSYTIGGSALTLTGSGVTNNSTSAQTLNVPIVMGASQTINAASGNITLGGVVSGSGKALTKTGANTLTLAGLSATAANNYTGNTTNGGGTLAVTTTDPSLTGGLTFGAAAASAVVGTLDLSAASATFGGDCLVQTASSTANTNIIGSGKTLLLKGALTVGYGNTILGSATKLNVTGLGTLSLGTSGTPTGANVQIGGNPGTLDMSGLSTFYANLGSGTFRIGSTLNPNSSGTSASTVVLAADSTIQASALTLSCPDGGVTQSLKLGSGVNVINVATLNVAVSGADGRSGGSLTFNGGTGTLKVRSQADTVNGRATLNVGVVTWATSITTSNIFDTTSHSADLRFGTMTVGSRTAVGAAGGTTTGEFKFDTGTLDADDLIAGSRSGSAGALGATPTGIVTLGGGTVTFNNLTGPIQLGTSSLGNGTAVGILNVTNGTVTVAANGGNSIRLGDATVVGGTASGTLNLTGGTLTVAGDIIRGAATGTSTAEININGASAVLDLGGNDITGLTGGTYTDGTVKNLGVVNTGLILAGTGSRVFDQGVGVSGEIQGAVDGSGVGLTKNGLGTLTLSGANGYSGATAINAGELIGKTAGSCANSAVTVASGATNGVQLAAANGQWTCGGLTYSAGNTYADFDFTATAPSATVAPLQISGDLAVNSTVNVIARRGSALTAGISYPLITWTGSGPANLSGFGTVTLPASMPGTLSLNTGTKTISVMAGIKVPNLAYNNAPGLTRKIELADMQAAGLASSQGSPTYTISLPSGTSAQGGSVTTDGSRIFYTPSGTPASDSFNYTVSDGTAAATATVTITFGSVAGAQIATELIGNDGADHARFTFYGIPNTSYHVQRATVLTPTPNWTNADAGVTTGADGSYLWTDTVTITSLGGTVYYRISYP
jgi:autotransporter-associated beta strand protein